eukprot:snap_masked-scaffold_4-processed-gene-8.5-mRNA-1 protein AED:0.00 eAED:0.00 QI:0/-1/0/1/-1/1/1/0/490
MTSTENPSAPLILCCLCGTPTPSNPSNTCTTCLQSTHDISSTLQKQSLLFHCRRCERYQRAASPNSSNTQTSWIQAPTESPQLLALCLKKIKGIGKVLRLVNAKFVWTEPHSKRIKVSLTLSKEVENNVVVKQTTVITFIVQNKMCPDCHKVEAKNTWNTVVQVRQKVKHKKTFLLLEQLILKDKMYVNTTNIEQKPNGIDFFFSQKNHALQFVDFLSSKVPLKKKVAKKLISADLKSNVANYHHTFHVEIVPICKEDFIIYGKRYYLCLSVSSAIILLDVQTFEVMDISSMKYYQKPFLSTLSSSLLKEYIVLDVTEVPFDEVNIPHARQKLLNTKRGRDEPEKKKKGFKVVDVEVARASDFGVNDKRFFIRCHLGKWIKVGDSVLGYDLVNTNLEMECTQDVVLVKKHYPLWRKKNRTRKWKLKKLLGSGDAKEEEQFLRDIEEDTDLQEKIDIYAREGVVEEDGDMEMEEDAPVIKVGSLLNDLTLR